MFDNSEVAGVARKASPGLLLCRASIRWTGPLTVLSSTLASPLSEYRNVSNSIAV
jgi:hypothetical protein